jgi:hypothetical protein
VLLVLAIIGCHDALDQRLAIVDRPRVLAILAEPPEVAPGASVTLAALLAGPDGPLSASPAWSLCAAPKPPTEDASVADGCLADANAITDLGTAAAISATIPSDACRTFGPDVVAAGFRPRAPDATGGYYQPVRSNAPSLQLAFGFVRITCNLANAAGDLAEQYKTTYVANANPSLTGLAIDGVRVDPARPANVTADHDVTLTTGWPADAAESFLYFDPDAMELVTRREAMRVSWFATEGDLAVDASAIGADDPALVVSTTWHTPNQPGPTWIWLVLRDSRGGLVTATFAVTVVR